MFNVLALGGTSATSICVKLSANHPPFHWLTQFSRTLVWLRLRLETVATLRLSQLLQAQWKHADISSRFPPDPEPLSNANVLWRWKMIKEGNRSKVPQRGNTLWLWTPYIEWTRAGVAKQMGQAALKDRCEEATNVPLIQKLFSSDRCSAASRNMVLTSSRTSPIIIIKKNHSMSLWWCLMRVYRKVHFLIQPLADTYSSFTSSFSWSFYIL